jgi:hypothetical protein
MKRRRRSRPAKRTGTSLHARQGARTSEVQVVTGCAWYRPEQWERLREVSVDRDKLADTFDEWLETAEKSLPEMRKAGIYAEKIDVDVEELVAWCQALGREVNADTRVEYVALLTRQRHQAQDREAPARGSEP